MARPLRIEYPCAVYHVTSRGSARADIFLSDGDRQTFLDVLAGTIERYNWLCHAFCLLDNHYHAIIEMLDHLSLGMSKYVGSSLPLTFERYVGVCPSKAISGIFRQNCDRPFEQTIPVGMPALNSQTYASVHCTKHGWFFVG